MSRPVTGAGTGTSPPLDSSFTSMRFPSGLRQGPPLRPATFAIGVDRVFAPRQNRSASRAISIPSIPRVQMTPAASRACHLHSEPGSQCPIHQPVAVIRFRCSRCCIHPVAVEASHQVLIGLMVDLVLHQSTAPAPPFDPRILVPARHPRPATSRLRPWYTLCCTGAPNGWIHTQ